MSYINHQNNLDHAPYDYYQGGRQANTLTHDPRFPVQPVDPTYQTYNGTYNGTNYNRNRDQRFNDYRQKANDYKYNVFSLIDEPWNRLCEFNTCGSCPGN